MKKVRRQGKFSLEKNSTRKRRMSHINYLRSREVAEAGVDVVGTACPLCQTMLEDGMGGLEMENPPRVMDLIEMVDLAMGRTY
ncbi:conserved hypothetical protein [delta proteobacterium NaphS2]|nr:conserved hypothetical protein [delta proteobacterium NaphS2]